MLDRTPKKQDKFSLEGIDLAQFSLNNLNNKALSLQQFGTPGVSAAIILTAAEGDKKSKENLPKTQDILKNIDSNISKLTAITGKMDEALKKQTLLNADSIALDGQSEREVEQLRKNISELKASILEGNKSFSQLQLLSLKGFFEQRDKLEIDLGNVGLNYKFAADSEKKAESLRQSKNPWNWLFIGSATADAEKHRNWCQQVSLPQLETSLKNLKQSFAALKETLK